MVQANADGRPRSRRARQSEEQAPLVKSYLSGSTGYQGTPHPGAAHGRPQGLPADPDRRGPSLLGVPRWAEGWDRRREAGIWAWGSHARCGARR